ncbi:RNA polymerase subunit sigma-70 [Embleya hyalina]|uniref:RNA polymerase sigma factor n=1 Tax=Embleya hyalina TaxID=516124 RepID=A0A401Z6N4_9ACTN|nr:RNA polymerase subunit sigma-70 [Embleya hyalina]GCE02476.1 RNA polymerase sigma factor [Embleya hyalina]
MSTSDDVARGVLAAVRAEDEGAFVRLAEYHRNDLRVHCYLMLGSFTDAEDVLDRTLLRAWRARRGFTGHAPFRSWLYRIATNACLDALAAPARCRREIAIATNGAGEPVRSALAEVTWLQPLPDRPEDGAVATRDTVDPAFVAVLQHLPPRQRATLILRDVVHWPAADTADTLGMNVAGVKSALQRARRTLRAELPDRHPSDHDRPAGPDDAERACLERYVTASRRADPAALAALLHADARQAIPPARLVHTGRPAIVETRGPVPADAPGHGEREALPLAMNRRPAVAHYFRRPGEGVFTATNLDVLRIDNGLITEIVTFGPELLTTIGLGAILDVTAADHECAGRVGGR